MRELHLFAGCGGGILGGILLGHTTVCAVEIEPYRRAVLLQRQRDGILPKFPIWDDVSTFDGKPWRGLVDIICGGFPCQDISSAGRGAGLDGERSGLWSEYARIVSEVRPKHVFVENSPVLTSRGLGVVLGNLAAMGYDSIWGVLSAADAIWLGGTPRLDHERARIWIKSTKIADSNGIRRDGRIVGRQGIQRRVTSRDEVDAGTSTAIDSNEKRQQGESPLAQFQTYENWCFPPSQQRRHRITGATESASPEDADANGSGCSLARSAQSARRKRKVFPVGGVSAPTNSADIGQSRPRQRSDEPLHYEASENGKTDDALSGCKESPWQSEPGLDRVVHGMANQVERTESIGDGQVPAVAALAWRTLTS